MSHEPMSQWAQCIRWAGSLPHRLLGSSAHRLMAHRLGVPSIISTKINVCRLHFIYIYIYILNTCRYITMHTGYAFHAP